MRLSGKAALITGAGSGFGEGIAWRFAEEGARILAVDINGDAAARVAGEINETYQGAAKAHTADVSQALDVNGMVKAAIGEFEHLDIVVNNAGTTHRNQPMLEVDESEFDRVFTVNVKSIYLAARAAVPIMRKQETGGVFLNIASTAGVRPRPGLTWYNGSKGAAIVLTKSMAVELAPDNIRVCAINPVAGETPLLEKFMGEDTPEKREAFQASIPLGRFSRPRDIANAALYLCSDEAEFMTGVCLEVDGGRCV
ncbi:MAG: SDR family oxidoreductase [Pseudomonadota bacterium]